MIKRTFWLERIKALWSERSIVWLSGVRRAGKTTISRSIPNVEYFDCELPRIRALMADPEKFLQTINHDCVVLDEIHRLDNPSELLKIAADHFPQVKILATGSSSLGASAKFKDTLAGRKLELQLTPMICDDLKRFAGHSIKRRLIRGGLPQVYMSKKYPESYFQEWIDAYWAKDIQELFRLERKSSFQKFLELLMVQSGGIFEANKFSGPCAVSHTTIANYLSILEETYVTYVLRPFSTYKTAEIVAAPKVYVFDTGFVCYYKGIHELNSKNAGYLWEHFVLNEMQAQLQSRKIGYWRDKQGHEIDFIIERRGKSPIAVEAKWNSKDFDFANLRVFAHQYPDAEVFVVCSDLSGVVVKKIDGVKVTLTSLTGLVKILVK
jgi:predicted AAA+ superfamily ATPase